MGWRILEFGADYVVFGLLVDDQAEPELAYKVRSVAMSVEHLLEPGDFVGDELAGLVGDHQRVSFLLD